MPLGVGFLVPRLVCPFPGCHGELSRHKVDAVVIEQALLELLLYLRVRQRCQVEECLCMVV